MKILDGPSRQNLLTHISLHFQTSHPVDLWYSVSDKQIKRGHQRSWLFLSGLMDTLSQVARPRDPPRLEIEMLQPKEDIGVIYPAL